MATDDKNIIEQVGENPEQGFRLLLAKYKEPVYWHIRRLVVRLRQGMKHRKMGMKHGKPGMKHGKPGIGKHNHPKKGNQQPAESSQP